MSEAPLSDGKVAFGAADLTNCDREQIHMPGSIQPHGALLVLDPDALVILQAAGDLASLLGAEAGDLLGRSVTDRLDAADRERLAGVGASRETRPHHVFSFARGARTVDAVAHCSDDVLILELEPRRQTDPEDPLDLVRDMIARVQKTATVAEACDAIVQAVRAASGFDRVMLYKFLADGTGAVEAEARSDDVPAYLGLRYPASDIPRQARALYLKNWIRVIPDARYLPSPLQSAPGWPPRSIDLGGSALRSVSPIHLEYLANMGVAASMSLSIIIGGELWGLVACHNRTPLFPAYRRRVALELFAQMASFQLETKLEAADLGARLRQKTISEALVASLSGASELAAGLKAFQPKLLDYIDAAGVCLWIDGRFSAVGSTPDEMQVTQLVRWLNATQAQGVFHTDRLCETYPAAAAFAETASGIMALSVSRTPRDYVIWFKPEVIRTIRWAGDPNKPAQPGTDRISPRKSFAAWKQTVRRQSDPWTGLDIRTAQSLRLSLLEIVLEHTDQLARERERSRIQQQALLAELDRRILQWEEIAHELKQEGDRRAMVEDELSQVLRRTVLDQEAERQRIARELHDSLGQYLTVMRLDLDGIARDAGASDATRARVEKLKSLTADVGQEVNQLAWEIRPTALDDLGLQKAFQQFLEEWGERTLLKFDVHLALNDRRLPAAIETTLYRVLQEAIRNVASHAQARKVGVILEASATEVRLIVEDDGKGFVWDPRFGVTPASSRLGLLGIRERLALVGGLLEIETSPGSGTTLLIHVPL